MAAPANLLLAAACKVLPEGWSKRSVNMWARLTPDGWLRAVETHARFFARYGREEIGPFDSLRDAIAAVELAYCGCRVRR